MRVLLLALSLVFSVTAQSAENPFDNEAFKTIVKEYTASFPNQFQEMRGKIQTQNRNRATYPIDWQFNSRKSLPGATKACVLTLKNNGSYVHQLRNFFPVKSEDEGIAQMKQLESALQKSIPIEFERADLPRTHMRLDADFINPMFSAKTVTPFKIKGQEYYFDLFVYTFFGNTYLCLDLVTYGSPDLSKADLLKDLTTLYNLVKASQSQVGLTIAGIPTVTYPTQFRFLTEWFKDREGEKAFFLKLLQTLSATTGIEGKKEEGPESSEWEVRYIFEYKEKKRKVNFEIRLPKECSNKAHLHAIDLTVYNK
jgi:hypothetical protein